MHSGNLVKPDDSNVFDISKIIEREVEKIESEFMIKIDQKIIDHMKNEWGNSKFNTSLYSLQKQYNDLYEKLRCLDHRVRDLGYRCDRQMEDVDE